MAEPDFEQIAKDSLRAMNSRDGGSVFDEQGTWFTTEVGHLAAALRHVWNARGAADCAIVEFHFCDGRVEDEIKALDR